jgi:hypothetical protein
VQPERPTSRTTASNYSNSLAIGNRASPISRQAWRGRETAVTRHWLRRSPSHWTPAGGYRRPPSSGVRVGGRKRLNASAARRGVLPEGRAEAWGKRLLRPIRVRQRWFVNFVPNASCRCAFHFQMLVGPSVHGNAEGI